jgi:hypothetical protein
VDDAGVIAPLTTMEERIRIRTAEVQAASPEPWALPTWPWIVPGVPATASAEDRLCWKIFGDLRTRCRLLHASRSVRGQAVLHGFCRCGHPSIGDAGGRECRMLDQLSDGGDTAEWIRLAGELESRLLEEGR